MQGIDVASYQTGINLNVVPSDFVIVKVSEGTGYINPDFERQASQTLSAGKLLGLYHYASGAGSIAEADFFIQTAKNYIGKALLVLDWESGGNVAFGSESYAEAFLDRVKESTGITPVIYMSKGVTRDGYWADVARKYDLWVAQYPNYTPTGYQAEPWTDSKGYGAWNAPILYQYTSSGQLSGWGGSLDLNIAYISAEEWQERAGEKEMAGWNKDGNGWKFYEVIKNAWKYIDGYWYHFDANGYAACDGWELIDNRYFYFDKECHMKTGWLQDNGYWYYCYTEKTGDYPAGSMAIGFITIGEETFYLSEESSETHPLGSMLTGWMTDKDGKERFFNKEFNCCPIGAMVRNHKIQSTVDPNKFYWIKDDGTMAVSEKIVIAGKEHEVNDAGVIL